MLFIKLKISVEMKVIQRTTEHMLLAEPANYGNKLSWLCVPHARSPGLCLNSPANQSFNFPEL